MERQVPEIPWETLASNFELRTAESNEKPITQVYLRQRPTQAQEFTHFVQNFIQVVQAHADDERKKYPTTYSPPQADDIILDNEVVQRIYPTIRQMRMDMEQYHYPFEDSSGTIICPHQEAQHPDIDPEPVQYPASDHDLDSDNESTYSSDSSSSSDSMYESDEGSVRASAPEIYVSSVGDTDNTSVVQTSDVPRLATAEADGVAVSHVDGLESSHAPESTLGSLPPDVSLPTSADSDAEGDYDECKCALPWAERKMEAFLRVHSRSECYEFYLQNKESFFNLEVFKSLLLHGEMDHILRICSHPEQAFERWWWAYICPCTMPDLGWEHLCADALDAFMRLNLLRYLSNSCQPEGDGTNNYTPKQMYKFAMGHATVSGCTSSLSKYPHWQYFGFQCYSQPLGPVKSDKDVREASFALQTKGLPLELADIVLQMADYKNSGSFVSSEHGPFHPYNQHATQRYMDYCWSMIIRCEVTARATNMQIDWDEMVSQKLADLARSTANANWNSVRLYEHDWIDGRRKISFVQLYSDA